MAAPTALTTTEIFRSLHALTEATGLTKVGSGDPIPLNKVAVSAKIVDFCAQITIEQHYKNVEENPIEATYLFPLTPKAAICEFSITIDDKKVIGVVEEKQRARERYDDAIATGHGAYLLECKRSDIFQLSVGNLPPKKEAVVYITYVTELDIVISPTTKKPTVVFSLPMTIAPKYQSERRSGSLRNQLDIDSGVGGWEDIQLSHTSTSFQTLSLAIDIDVHATIDDITCTTGHKLLTTINGCKASVSLAQTYALDGDVVVHITTTEPHSARSWLERNPTASQQSTTADPYGSVVLLSFYPEFDMKKINSEIVFVVDRSGSMSGDPIRSAVRTLREAIAVLTPEMYFQIVSFGSTYSLLFDGGCVPADSENIRSANTLLDRMNADMGGTELYAPLEAVFQLPPRKGNSRSVFLLTDGAIDNTNAVISLVRRNAHTTRTYTFGIGSAVSRELVEGCARAGRGACEFVDSENGGRQLHEAVLRQYTRAREPSLSELAIEWDGVSTDDAARIATVPRRLPPMFNREPYCIYAFLPIGVQPIAAKLRAFQADDTVVTTIAVPPEPYSNAPGRLVLQRMAAKRLITELEEDSKAGLVSRNEACTQIIQLGLKYSIASEYTSFIAVEEREHATEGTMMSRSVPSLLPRSSGSSSSSSGGAMELTGYDPTIEDSYRKMVVIDNESLLISFIEDNAEYLFALS